MGKLGMQIAFGRVRRKTVPAKGAAFQNRGYKPLPQEKRTSNAKN